MIGILDWGIGGLGFYAKLKQEKPGADVIYLSDAGSIPYGKLPGALLRSRVAKGIDYLKTRGADRVVVACNAASTVLSSSSERSVVSIIDYGVQAVLRAGLSKVAVVGGERTIRSRVYHRILSEYGIHVRGRIAQPLSGIIERGEHETEEFKGRLRQILQPLSDYEALLLACTHYPAAAKQFREVLPHVSMFDPVDSLLDAVRFWRILSSDRADRILTTGNPEEMQQSAVSAFNVMLPSIEQVTLPISTTS